MSTGALRLPWSRGRARAGERSRAARYWEIDLARTVAIAMMVVYHAGYDIDFLVPDSGIEPRQGGWLALQIATGSLFLLVAGVSVTLSDAAAARRGMSWRARSARHVRRGAVVIACGMGISLVTWLALDDRYVRFGILHAIGTAIVLSPLFGLMGRWVGLAGVAVIVAGLLVADERSDVPGMLILGWRPTGSAGVDYYPLLPWLGLFLIGMALGRALYPEGRRGAWGTALGAGPPTWVTAPGRHSLVIYLVHQPVLIAVLAATLTVAGVDWQWPE